MAVGGMRNPNSIEDNASTENGSLTPLVPVMIEVRLLAPPTARKVLCRRKRNASRPVFTIFAE